MLSRISQFSAQPLAAPFLVAVDAARGRSEVRDVPVVNSRSVFNGTCLSSDESSPVAMSSGGKRRFNLAAGICKGSRCDFVHAEGLSEVAAIDAMKPIAAIP